MTDSRLADFIVAGAPRCATTWVYRALDRHPDVAMAKPVVPEPKFFLVDELYDQGLERYAQWFAEARPDQLCGEKSTNYLEGASVAERIRACLPDVRLVFVLRDPVERAYSNYLWSRHNGMETESFERALDLEEEREASLEPRLRYARPHALFSRGLYARHLGRFYERFDRGRILCVFQEDLDRDPQAFLLTLHGFLGLDPRPQDADPAQVNQAGGEGREPMPEHVRDRLREAYAGPNKDLENLLRVELPW